MILPLYASIERMDHSLVEASYDLGHNKSSTFWRVIVPSTMPGIVAGVLLVFIPAIGDFVTPELLGGVKTTDDRHSRSRPVRKRQQLAARLGHVGAVDAVHSGGRVLLSEPSRRGRAVSRKSSLRPRYLYAHALIVFAFLFAPIVVLVVFSFNHAQSSTKWTGFSTRWYSNLIHNEDALQRVPDHIEGCNRCNDRRDDSRNPRRVRAHPLHLPRRGPSTRR